MRPYCPNNSNFTFRNICCEPPVCDEWHKEKECECKKRQLDCWCNQPCFPKCDCHCKDKPQKKPECNKPSCSQSPLFICLPISSSQNCACNPFTFVMIGYMMGKNYSNNSFCCDNEFKY